MVCSQCQTPNSDSARFCNNCGATLSGSQSADDLKTPTNSDENAATVGAQKTDKLIGRTIEGRYRIDSLIGLGGMGSVYRVTRLLIGDEVAMKILHSERVADPHAGERFRREAQAAARLKHPNAVSIYDFGITSDGLQYLVMELLEGLSLRQIIKQEGSLPPSVAAEITTQVCAALDEAHRRHIVHRDIKPDNIIINQTFAGLRVKVLDFGIAKLRDDVASHLTQTGSVMGTPHYMSPEQCLGEELDSRADIYSMGIVLYEMLCGRVPFNSPISTAVVVQHVNQPPPSLRTINIGISPQVEAVVFHALEKQRDARPPTASALAQELTTAVHPTSVQTSSHSTWPQISGPLQPPTHVTDETVVRSAARTPTANEMPATVHLPAVQASGPTPSGRSTVPSGTLSVTKANQRSLLTIGAAVFGIVLLGAVIAMIAWSLRKPNDVAGLNKGDKNAVSPTPPAGMAYVQGGEFTMGNNAGAPLEQPAHTVTIQPFFVDIYEVTREDYEKFMNATGHRAPAGWVNGHYPPGTAKWPVTGVDWDDANAYAKSVGKRLLTEEEWEFAARGTDGRRYPWGNEWSKGLANADNSRGGFSDVGFFKGASPYGLFDMVGNAWEWTSSDLAAYPGGSLPGPATTNLKVIRGGCFLSRPDQATTTIRVGWPARGGDEYDNTSFRCAKDAPTSSQSMETSGTTPAANSISSNFSKNFIGLVGGKFKIEMKLQRNGGDLTGSYFFQPARDIVLHGNYTRELERWADKNNALARIDVPIRGTVDNQQNFIVEEFDDKGSKTGIFRGQFVSDGGMEGMWSKPNGKSQTQFSLKDEGDKASGGNYRIVSKVISRKTGKMKVDVSYPQLEGLPDENVQKNFNEQVRALVTKDIGNSSNDEGEQGIGFSVDYRSETLLSVVFGASGYTTGAAHGWSYEFSYHYDLRHNKELKLSDFFLPGVNHLSLLSKLCAKDIARQKRKNGMEDIDEDGEAAAFNALKEDATFYPAATGLVFIFDPYQVGSYAEGYYVVTIPYSQLRGIIDPNGPLAQFVS